MKKINDLIYNGILKMDIWTGLSGRTGWTDRECVQYFKYLKIMRFISKCHHHVILFPWG